MNEVTNTIEGTKEVKHEFPNTYEFGKAGNRHTIKYWSKEELAAQINYLKEMDLLDEVIL